jgi:hypothetical protein
VLHRWLGILVLSLIAIRQIWWVSLPQASFNHGHRNASSGHDGALIPFPHCNESRRFFSEYTFEYAFKPAYYYDFYVQEAISMENAVGKIHITRGSAKQKAPVVVHAQVGATNPEAFGRVRITPGEKTLRIASSERPTNEPSNSSTCVFVYIIVAVRPGVAFGNFDIRSTTFPIELDPVAAFETSVLSLVSTTGAIASSQANPGRIRTLAFAHVAKVNTTSGSVVGLWGLSTSLTIDSGAGDINIDVVTYKHSYGPYAPADITIRSSSGNVTLRMPSTMADLSIRNYKTDIQSEEGSIKVNCVHGSNTNLVTYHGSIDAELLPWNDWKPQGSKLRTFCSNGSTNVRVLQPVTDPYYNENPLNWTASEHVQMQGSMRLQYPKQWLGQVEGRTSKGHIMIHGPELEDVEWGENSVSARNGHGGSTLNFTSDYAIVDLGIGEV